MINLLHSGRLGDIVYSIQAAKRISERHDDKVRYFIPDGTAAENDYFRLLKTLLEEQPCVAEVQHFVKGIKDEDYHNLQIEYNLDNFRGINPWQNHVLLCHLNALHLSTKGWNLPWLAVEHTKSPTGQPFAVFQRTFRYRNPRSDWKGLIQKIKADIGEDELYFVGTDHEYKNFLTVEPKVKRLNTVDILEFAEYMKAAKWVATGMSVGLVLAQGMGIKHYFELEPRHVKTVCTGLETELTI